MNYFSSAKNERDIKPATATAMEPIPVTLKPAAPATQKLADAVSTLGQGMIITGNVLTTGSVQIFGRVTGDVQASHVAVREGARVEGNITAEETTVQGSFKGTIRSNSVKLHATAVVEGEIFNKLLTVEEHALFEGVARRLECPVSAPSLDQAQPVQLQPAQIQPVVSHDAPTAPSNAYFEPLS